MRTRDAFRSGFTVDRLERMLILKLIRGELRAGDYLPSLPRLSAECAVSKTTMRAAIGRLVSRGLLKNVPGKGLQVQELLESCDLELLLELIGDVKDVARALELEAQLLDLLSVVFLEVLHRAIACRTDDHLKWYKHYLRVVLDCIDRDAHVGLICSAQYQLLRVVAAAGGSVAFTVIINALRSYLEGREALDLFPPEAWSQLYDALEQKDLIRGRQIMQRCFDVRTAKVMQRLMKARGFTGSNSGSPSAAVELTVWPTPQY